MRIVVDTNVLISAVFFQGGASFLLESIIKGFFSAYSTDEITAEYDATIEKVMNKKGGRLDNEQYESFKRSLTNVQPKERFKVCRDEDDDKFIDCAVEAKALYIISGDKDLLEIESFKGIEVITIAEFVRRFLS